MNDARTQPASGENACVQPPIPENRHLELVRVIDAPPEKLFRAWTEPELMKKWFCPRPWTTPHIETDARTGGSSFIVMRGPDGQEIPHRGVYLEVVPNRRIVFTDAFVNAWEPSAKPFMVGIVEFQPAPGGKTRYVARAMQHSHHDRHLHNKIC